MKELSENTIIAEIENEYKKIDNRWMKLHYYTFIALVIFGFVIESILALVWYRSGDVDISVQKYVIKYIVAPVFTNLLFVIIAIIVMRYPRIRTNAKVYTISLLFVGSCLVFYTVHSLFSALYIIFTLPILMTVIYCDYKLTSVTALVSIVSKSICELFVIWDPDKINPLDSQLGVANFLISILILILFYCVCIVVIRFEKEKSTAGIQKELEYYHTQQKLNIDELTKIYNRTALRKAFQSMTEDGLDSTYIFSMMDIDNFKDLNDTFGHEVGDDCLKELATIFKNNCGENSMPFRFGGDEFCILFKDSSLKEVIKTCRDIQSDLKQSYTSIGYMVMTLSIGIAVYDKKTSATQLVKNTDTAMYNAKVIKDCISVFKDMND